MLYPEMMDQFRDNFGIGVALEHVSSLLQQSLNFLVIRHDTCIQARYLKKSKEKFGNGTHTYTVRSITIVNDNEGVLAVRTLRMGIYLRRNTVGCPSCVSDADVILSLRLEVKIGACE